VFLHIGIFKIKGCELLFISMVRAVEGLNVRYINSPHASFYLLSSQGIIGFKSFYTIKNSFREEERGEKKICY